MNGSAFAVRFLGRGDFLRRHYSRGLRLGRRCTTYIVRVMRGAGPTVPERAGAHPLPQTATLELFTRSVGAVARSKKGKR
jgi:hypothetical protein